MTVEGAVDTTDIMAEKTNSTSSSPGLSESLLRRSVPSSSSKASSGFMITDILSGNDVTHNPQAEDLRARLNYAAVAAARLHGAMPDFLQQHQAAIAAAAQHQETSGDDLSEAGSIAGRDTYETGIKSYII